MTEHEITNYGEGTKSKNAPTVGDDGRGIGAAALPPQLSNHFMQDLKSLYDLESLLPVDLLDPDYARLDAQNGYQSSL